MALRPLTNDEKMPLDLAAEGNHHSTVEFLRKVPHFFIYLMNGLICDGF